MAGRSRQRGGKGSKKGLPRSAALATPNPPANSGRTVMGEGRNASPGNRNIGGRDHMAVQQK